MIYFVGGASRSGKSLLPTRLLARAGVPWLALDVLRMGLVRGVPCLCLDPDVGDLVEAARLWPVVRAMAENLIDDGRSYLIEGVCLDPFDVAPLVARGDARACFLGYPRLTDAEKLRAVRVHTGGPNDWLAHQPDEAVLAQVVDGCRISAGIEQACAATGLAFFDSGRDFDPALMAAEN
jgi:hypothetical protein